VKSHISGTIDNIARKQEYREKRSKKQKRRLQNQNRTQMLESFKRALPGGTVANFSSRSRSISPIQGSLEVVNEVFRLRRKDVSVDIEMSGSPERPSKVTVQHLSPGKDRRSGS